MTTIPTPSPNPSPHRRAVPRRLAVAVSLAFHGTAVAAGIFLGPLLPVRPKAQALAAVTWSARETLERVVEEPETPPPIEVTEPAPVELEDPELVPEPAEREPAFELEMLASEDLPPDRSWALFSRILPRERSVAEADTSPPPPPPAPAESSAPANHVEPQPLAGQNPPPKYPPRAVRLGLEGTVELLVEVDVHGKVSALKVTKSSGATLLDHEATRTVQAWRFDRGPGTTYVEIVFQLENRR